MKLDLAFCLCLFVLGLEADVTGEEVCQAGNTHCGSSRPSSVPMVVVEEHHHVIDHWFNTPGFREGVAFNATLLHIDAHPDFGMPLKHDLLAPWPKDLNKLRENLENDQFIVMSARWGLFKRIVNIFPQFAKMYIRSEHHLQTLYYEYGMQANGDEYCECRRECLQCKAYCQNSQEQRVKRKSCKIEHVVEVVSMSLEAARRGGLSQFLPEGEPLFLDIDEDFFAVEMPFEKLVKAGNAASDATREWKRGDILESLQKWLRHKFCARPPRVAQREQAVDTFLRGIVSVALAAKEAGLKAEADAKKLVTRFVEQVPRELFDAVVDALCQRRDEDKDKASVFKIAKTLGWRLLDMFPLPSIHGLLEYGFCIDCDEVPREGYLLWTCTGSSTKHDMRPDVHRLDKHTPSEAEVVQKTAQLRALLLSEVKTIPSMVTICRSLRDAYIPRNLWPGIEHGMLSIASDFVTGLGQSVKVDYDRDCHWGAAGFPSRRVLPVAEFLHRENIATTGHYASILLLSETETA